MSLVSIIFTIFASQQSMTSSWFMTNYCLLLFCCSLKKALAYA